MSRAKGRRTQNKAIKHLENLGYIVDVVERTGKFRKYKDLYSGFCVNCWKREDECCDNKDEFEGFDIIAIKSDHTILVQIKTNSPATQRTFKKFAKKFATKHRKVWCMTWYDRSGWVIQDYTKTKIIKTDLRKTSTK